MPAPLESDSYRGVHDGVNILTTPATGLPLSDASDSNQYLVPGAAPAAGMVPMPPR